MVRARLDQHFLVDEDAAARIVGAAAPVPGAAVLEIGPGHGILTRRLLEGGARVTAVELDARLHAQLAETWKDEPRFTALLADFLRLELSSLPSPVQIVSNLPYSVATPILQRLLPWPGWTSAVLMFQKEVAERIVAEPGSRKYGILSLSVAAYADAAEVCAVPKRAFRPTPQVDSAVVRLERLERPRLPEGLAPETFFRVVRAAFGQRRKMAANSLASGLGIERDRAAATLEKAGAAPTARAEELSLEVFARLAVELR